MSETTMALLGKLLGPEVTGRDAIHVAVVPVTAAEFLSPGEHVGLLGDGKVGNGATPWVGIVDPYLTARVQPGERFFLFLYPRTITSLRHEWTHPAFAPRTTDTTPEGARAWVEAFAAELDQTYNRLMAAADLWVLDEEYTYDNSETYKDVDDAKWPTFWKHYETLTDRKVEDHEARFFTCSC